MADLPLELPFALELPDQAIDSDELPWVPFTDGGTFRPLRFDMVRGQWIEITRMTPQCRVSRHRHLGGQVLGFCLEGSWRYLERDWVAKPGTLIYEPPGDVHTLEAGPEGMTTLFVIEGSIQYLDDADAVVAQDDVLSIARMYYDHCRATGIAPRDLRF